MTDCTSPAKRLARAAADAMWATDIACRELGVAVVSVGPGEAVLSLQVTGAMLTAHGVCGRGFVFLLADSAMAYASSSHGLRTVAQLCDIAFLRDVGPGERLSAHAVERHRAGRKAIYDVRVANDAGAAVAEMRGQTISLGAALVAADGLTTVTLPRASPKAIENEA